jgi:prepilin-type processing-associated H-X9-DG protein
MDSSHTPDTPISRTASVIDFRQELHVEQRLGRVHGKVGGRSGFNVGFFDGSARLQWEIPVRWATPLP